MKVEQKIKVFNPVVITLESQLEVDILAHLVGSIGDNPESKVRVFTDKLYDMLEPLSEVKPEDWPNTFFRGYINAQP